MKTVAHISLQAIDDTRGSAASGVKVPLQTSKSYLWRCVDIGERIEGALADQPLVLVSRGRWAGAPTVLQVWQDDGRVQTLMFDGRRAVLQDDSATRYGCAGVSALRRVGIARAMAMRYARLCADARALVLEPRGVDEQISPAIEFNRPENWGFEKVGRAYQWTARNLSDTTTGPTSPPPARSTVTRSRFHDVFNEMCGEKWGGQLGGDRGDALRCIPELRLVREKAQMGASPALGAVARRRLDEQLCFDLAVALGRCRLLGVPLSGTDDFTLTAAAARRAVTRANDLLGTELEVTTNLAGRLSIRRTYRERDYVLERLEARMDLWALSVAVAEAEEAAEVEGVAATATVERAPRGQGVSWALEQGTVDARQLARSMRVMRWMTGRVDGNLQHHAKILRSAAGTHLLANWRRLLARGYRGEAGEALPWWLDGCIG